MTQISIIDAEVWAKEWCHAARLRRDEGGALIDEAWMVAWFANAIKTGQTQCLHVGDGGVMT